MALTLVGLNDKFRTASEAQAEIFKGSFYGFSDAYNFNEVPEKEYPIVWSEYPNSVELRDGQINKKGYEDFTLVWRVFDLQLDKTEKEKVERISELEVMGKEILNRLIDTNSPANGGDIQAIIGNVNKERADWVFNDVCLAVLFTTTIRVYTGWHCTPTP